MTYENKKRVVVFDLDETLGYFTEIGIFWDSLNKYISIDQDNQEKHFFEIIDLFKIYLRPYIINILRFIKRMKQKDKCYKVMIYTNNQGAESWTKMISHYFENKIKFKLFDQLILAFKVNGKRVEIGRTSHGKSITDLFRCADIPQDCEICFLDDKFHPDMEDECVYYIKMKPYHYSKDFNQMIEQYYGKFHNQMKLGEEDDFKSFMIDYMKSFGNYKYKKSDEEHEIDGIVSKQVINCLKDFFKEKSIRQTRRKRKRKDGTRKMN